MWDGPDLTGQLFGRCQIIERIGCGPHGAVYRARLRPGEGEMAVKVINADGSKSERFRADFSQIFTTVAYLEHRHILPVYDFGMKGPLPYVVLPLMSGSTWREYVAQPRSLEEAVPQFRTLLGALDYAHQRQVIHGSIKPTNMWMTYRQGNWTILADFGIAALWARWRRETTGETVIDAPEYLAPEQAQAERIDHRTDLYAMGVLLFELLTGRPPFRGVTAHATIALHVTAEVPSPRRYNPALSPCWDEVIRRSLAKPPQERYPSAGAMDAAIQAAWSQGGA
jgi:serine/threonine-protein kinase